MRSGAGPRWNRRILKIADPREVATVIELLAMDTEYMPRVWAKLSSLKVTEPISIDAETARLLDLFEGGYVDRKSMPVPDLLLCSLVTKCAKMRSQLRSPNKFPSVKAWKKISQLARQIAKLIHDNEMFETLFRLHDGDDATLANKRPLEYRYLTIAQTGDIMVRPGTRRLGKARRGIIELVPTLSEFFRSHFDRPLDREVADIVSVVSGEIIDSDRVKMRRTRREHDVARKTPSAPAASRAGNKIKNN